MTSIVELSNDTQLRVKTLLNQYNLFLVRWQKFCSDRTVVEKGTISVATSTRATLTSENIPNLLRDREKRRFLQTGERQRIQ